MVNFKMTTLVEGIPTLLHLSVFLFFAGLVEFLFPINRAVAITILVVVAASGAVYAVITILPAIRRNCPYRTPLSGAFWRLVHFIALLFHRHPKVGSKIMQSDMALGREVLATLPSEALEQRDLRAIDWTIESLTEDSELEPFVAGITDILTANPQSLHSRSPTSSKIQNQLFSMLVEDHSALLNRILALLTTCQEGGILSEVIRRKRAITCIRMIALLIRGFKTTNRSFRDFIRHRGRHLARTLIQMRQDKNAMIASASESTIEEIAIKLRDFITAGLTLWTMRSLISDIPRMLALLSIFDSIHICCNILSTVTPHSRTEHRTRQFISELRDKYIPRHLLADRQKQDLESSERQHRIVAYLKAICTTLSSFPYDGISSDKLASTIRSLLALRNDESPVIAYYARCTVLRLAYHLQSDIAAQFDEVELRLLATLTIHNSSQILEDLDVQGMLNEAHNIDDGVMDDLVPQIMLAHPHGGASTWMHFQNVRGVQLSKYLSEMSADDVECLSRFQLRTTYDQVTSNFGKSGKIALSRGNIALVISLLDSLKASTIPIELADLSLDTLQLISKDLTARFSSLVTQTLLVKLIGEVSQYLRAELVRLVDLELEGHADSNMELIRLINFELEWSKGDAEGEVAHSTQPPASDDLRQPASKSEPIRIISDILKILINVLGTVGAQDPIRCSS